MAGRNFYRSARRPLGLANEASGSPQNKHLGTDDSLNLSDVIRMASKTTESRDNGEESDSELSGLSDDEQAHLRPAKRTQLLKTHQRVVGMKVWCCLFVSRQRYVSLSIYAKQAGSTKQHVSKLVL